MADAGTVVAVRGTGSIGLRHLRVLRDRLTVPTVAIPVRAGRASELEALNFRTLTCVEALSAYLSTRSIVATDTSRHLQDAKELLRFGDVLVEKPLATSVAGIADLERTAAALDRTVFTGFCLRFHAGLQHFRARLPDIGRAHSVRIECQSYLPDWRPDRGYRESYSARSSDGGVLRDLSHELDYAVWLFGRPNQVWCVLRHGDRLSIESDEAADLMWEAPGGAVVSLRLDYVTRVPRRRMNACGANGTIEWDAIGGAVTVQLVDRPLEVVILRPDHDEILGAQASAFLGMNGPGAESLLATLDEAAFIVALTDAAREASRSRGWHPVSDWRTAS